MTMVDTPRLSPWHAGEIALQKTAGVVERMDVVGRRVIRDTMIEQHRDFHAALPFVVLGTVDGQGDAWASVRAGKPGFLRALNPHRLAVAAPRDSSDPADSGLDDGDAIGLLGIDLATRRRNRLNGTVRRTGADGFSIDVEQSFGNCPRYIQRRLLDRVAEPDDAGRQAVSVSRQLDGRARAIVAKADTFFVATYVDDDDGHRHVDVSHRGGRAGFVRIDPDGTLTIPDFAGNLFFNTLGNIWKNPRAGLVFVDFETGDLVQLTGPATVVLDAADIAAFQGAERMWQVKPTTVVFRPDALSLRFSFVEDGWSPNTGMTGDWREAANRLEAAALADSWRPFRVAKIVEESVGTRSLYLEPADGVGLIPHKAGQHLPIRVHLPGERTPLRRTYTLSVAPSDGVYRLSVKAEGRVSRHLHALEVGDGIEARAPGGVFVIDAAAHRPAVMVAAGIGITPMLAMLRHVVYEGFRTRRVRPTWLFYAARSLSERSFDDELRQLVAAS